MTDAERLGRQIEEARNAKGWTQKDLASQLGRGGAERTIQSWERGERSPRGKTLARVRMLLDLEGDEDETRSQWPPRVRRVVDVLSDQMDDLSPADLKVWRHELIVGLLAERYEPRGEWSDDVEVLRDIVGSYLAALDGE